MRALDRSEAIKALEDAGILSWVNRIVRVKDSALDLFGHWANRWRVLRTSNAYQFSDPQAVGGHKSAATPGNASKSEIPAGNTNQDFILLPFPLPYRFSTPTRPLEPPSCA